MDIQVESNNTVHNFLAKREFTTADIENSMKAANANSDKENLSFCNYDRPI
jgi:hypothetical protein